ncbi:protein kinase [candidate division KSB1 bacterium]|nr:protein kinase [candidate division KSB1 bacterium]
MKKIGKFKIIEEIGKGGMGIVYKALDPYIDREVAIKVIIEKELGLPEVKERFHREARSAGKLSHENITIVHEVGEVEGKPYIVMEYLRGSNLSELISKKKPIELNQKISYAIQICKALKFAHANKIIHRDIKPENIMVLDDGKIKIMDFGIARPESSTLTQQGMIVGTLAYMSPEQIKGIKIDKRADIFSFGVLLYELLSYKRPFQGDNTTIMYKIVHEEPESINLEDSAPVEDLQKILSKCLQKKPEERYSDCSNIINDLEIILQHQQQDQTISGLLIEGRAFFEEKRLNEARTRFDKVLEIDPNNEEAKFLKQQCLAIEDKIETMIVSAEETAQKKKLDKLIVDGNGYLEQNK